MGHGAVGGGCGHEHRLCGVQQLDALTHEGDARKHHRLLRQLHGELCQVKRVSHIIGHGLDLGRRVVVRKDYGVARGGETAHLHGERIGARRGGAR